ncbi:MAG: serine/threonine protein kinase [Polyangiaceae bacterium]|nr:serine/threonine protein kinase [Polyangiaceae bacterium]
MSDRPPESQPAAPERPEAPGLRASASGPASEPLPPPSEPLPHSGDEDDRSSRPLALADDPSGESSLAEPGREELPPEAPPSHLVRRRIRRRGARAAVARQAAAAELASDEGAPSDEQLEARLSEPRSADGSAPEALAGAQRDTALAATEPGVAAPRARRSLGDSQKGPRADPLIGMVVADRYRIVNLLGRGGMGIVYRVEHVRIGKLLAMKLLAGELSANKEIVRRFKQEALTVSKLSSAHTVQVFDYGVWQHMTYLVMELVEGRDLGRLARRDGPLPFERLGRLMVQVCSSLSEAHRKGIVHRDIKPENIMVLDAPGGTELAKVLDFGLAKLREGHELNEVTTQGAVIGTPYYMSPEQVLGEQVDGRSDIYSLGGVMFRALTGTYPFTAGSPMGMFTKHLTEPPPLAAERVPELHIPLGVSALVHRCMQKSPADRFQTVDDVRVELMKELDALGLGSSDRLLLGDSQRREARGWNEDAAAVALTPLPVRPDRMLKSQIATRDEVAAYERKLRRKRYGLWLGLATLPLAGGAAGTYFAVVHGQRAVFTGVEAEPNDQAAQATRVPLGATVRGNLGRRIDADTGDRDFFVLDLPPSEAPPGERRAAALLSLRLGALPNIPTCLLLYGSSSSDPLAQFCTGKPGQDLAVGAWPAEPGRYFVAVMQDRDPYGSGHRPFVYENVSDSYRLTVDRVEPDAATEIEPNDLPAAALRLAPGAHVDAALGWAGDEDVFCSEPGAERALRWRVEDPSRRPGTTLEATPLASDAPAGHNGGPALETGPLVRVHGAGAAPMGRPRLEADVTSPWRSPTFGAAGEHCLRVRLAADPWVDPREPPLVDPTPYRVILEPSAEP